MKSERQYVRVFETKCKTFEKAAEIRDEYFGAHPGTDALLRIKWRKKEYSLVFFRPVNVNVKKQPRRGFKSA